MFGSGRGVVFSSSRSYTKKVVKWRGFSPLSTSMYSFVPSEDKARPGFSDTTPSSGPKTQLDVSASQAMAKVLLVTPGIRQKDLNAYSRFSLQIIDKLE